jgi:formamidopyrimidine-DNA glycosylase
LPTLLLYEKISVAVQDSFLYNEVYFFEGTGMPELPEVECVVRGLRPRISGRTIRRVTVHLPSIVRGSPMDLAEHLPGCTFGEIHRRGKLIIMSLSRGLSLLGHLRMTGQLLYLPSEAAMEKHTHLIFHLDNGHHLRYRDQRQFGWLQLAETNGLEEHPQVIKLGPEPLDVPQEEFVRMVARRRRQIKPLLMDQTILAGMGNIYVDEALFRARIYPLRRASDLSTAKLKQLHGHIQDVLREAIDCSGSTVGQFRGVDSNSGKFQRFLRVYGHRGEPCIRCGRTLVKIRVGSRGTHICPRCQRAPKS